MLIIYSGSRCLYQRARNRQGQIIVISHLWKRQGLSEFVWNELGQLAKMVFCKSAARYWATDDPANVKQYLLQCL